MKDSWALVARRVLSVFVVLAGLLYPQSGHARDAAGLLEALMTTLSKPEVYLGGTTALAPLVTTGNKLVSFQPGTELAMTNLCDNIRAASHEILLQVYEWDDHDESGSMVRQALRDRIARARTEHRLAPLMLRIVVNHSWPALQNTPHHLLKELLRETLEQDPKGEHVLVELSRRKGFAFSIVHAKYAVIDGRILVLRTNNFLTLDSVSRDFFNFSVQLEGPVAATVRHDWLNLRAESTLVQNASHRPYSWPEVPQFDEPRDEDNRPFKVDQAGSPMAILAKNSRANFLTEGSPNPQNAGLISLINATDHEILSLNPALNVPAIKRAIENAIVLRSVDVTLILSLNMDRQVQHLLQGGDNADTVFELLTHLFQRGGIDAARHFHVRWASNGTGRAAPKDTVGNNHAKTALYDGEALWMGSMNWDWQSWSNSRELSVVVFDRSVAPRWQREIWRPVWMRAARPMVEDFPQCNDAWSMMGEVCRYISAGTGL